MSNNDIIKDIKEMQQLYKESKEVIDTVSYLKNELEDLDDDCFCFSCVFQKMGLILNKIKIKEYPSREFCKAINCPTQIHLEICENEACDEPKDYHGGRSLRERLVENTKQYCMDNCIAWKFHNWLQQNDYIIIKKVN